MLSSVVTRNNQALKGRLPPQRNLRMSDGVGLPLTRGLYAIHSMVEPGGKSHSTRVPSTGVASAHEAPLTISVGADSVLRIFSATAGSTPASCMTVRISAMTRLLVA